MIAFTLKFTSFSMFLSDVNHILDTFDFCSRIELFKNIFEIYKLVFIVFLLFLRIKNFSTIFEKKKNLKMFLKYAISGAFEIIQCTKSQKYLRLIKKHKRSVQEQ